MSHGYKLWDPPYNTGNDFVYRDNFTLDKDEYDEEAGVYDEDSEAAKTGYKNIRESSFNSSPEKINVEEIFKLLAPNASVKLL